MGTTGEFDKVALAKKKKKMMKMNGRKKVRAAGEGKEVHGVVKLKIRLRNTSGGPTQGMSAK